MQDDLQKAYSAYQQALYLLPNPKVMSISIFRPSIIWSFPSRRIQNFGMESVSFMTATVL